MSSYPAFLSPPRLCHLKKWTTFAGYGFNLHAEKGKAGQYIGKVDPDSPAEHGGLKTKDYLVEVNSVNVVVDYEAYKHCRENGVSINSSMPEVVSFTTPDSQPSATAAGVDEKQEKPIESVDQTAESSVTNAESVVKPSTEFTDRAQEDEDENVMPVGQEVIANPLAVEVIRN
uniref:PDZ domain-containing protein n=1 Tax=Macrostomum lignano TaxID=282301 RepID=A0A1I8H004_9PLAT